MTLSEDRKGLAGRLPVSTMGAMKPPPLPEETLQRVLRLARGNGLSVLIIAGLGTLLSLALGDWVGVAVGAIVAFGGWTELAGRKELLRGDADGMRRLVRAQWIVLGAILVYCVTRMASFDADTALGNLTPDMRTQLAEAGIDVATILPLVKLTFFSAYGMVTLVTLVYQGGMARHYRRRTDVVKAALAARLRPTVPPVAPSSPEDFVT